MSVTTHKDELFDNITLFEQQIKVLQSAIDHELTKRKSDILADQVHETTFLPASPAIATVEEPTLQSKEHEAAVDDDVDDAVKEYMNDQKFQAKLKKEHLTRLKQEEEQDYARLLSATKSKEKNDEEEQIKQMLGFYKQRVEDSNKELQTETKKLEDINTQLEEKRSINQQLLAIDIIKELEVKTKELEAKTRELEQIKGKSVFPDGRFNFEVKRDLEKKKEATEKDKSKLDLEIEKVQDKIVALEAEKKKNQEEIEALENEKLQVQQNIGELTKEKETAQIEFDSYTKPSGGKKTRKRKPIHDTRKRIKKIRCKPSTSKANESTSRRCRP